MSETTKINGYDATDEHLTFTISGEDYGLEINYIKDIIQMQEITRVPGVAPYIIGITNLRGSIVPVVDVRIRFGKEPQAYHERTCIVVIELDEMQIGMVVDAVQEVIHIPDSVVTQPPKMSAASENRYVRSIGNLDEKKIILLLDIQRLFYDGDVFPAAQVG